MLIKPRSFYVLLVMRHTSYQYQRPDHYGPASFGPSDRREIRFSPCYREKAFLEEDYSLQPRGLFFDEDRLRPCGSRIRRLLKNGCKASAMLLKESIAQTRIGYQQRQTQNLANIDLFCPARPCCNKLCKKNQKTSQPKILPGNNSPPRS